MDQNTHKNCYDSSVIYQNEYPKAKNLYNYWYTIDFHGSWAVYSKALMKIKITRRTTGARGCKF